MKIDVNILCQFFFEGHTEVKGFKLIEDKITSSDAEDGGADHEYIIQDTETEKFYVGYYTDWDLENTDYDEETGLCDGRIDLDDTLYEVEPMQKTITVYKRIK